LSIIWAKISGNVLGEITGIVLGNKFFFAKGMYNNISPMFLHSHFAHAKIVE